MKLTHLKRIGVGAVVLVTIATFATAQAAAPTTAAAKLKLPAIDAAMQAQMERKLPELNFDKVSFADAIDFLRDVTGSNIVVNWRRLEAAGVDRNTPITMRAREIRFDKALEDILRSAGDKKLTYIGGDGVLHITTVEAAPGLLAARQRGAGRKINPKTQAILDRKVPEANFDKTGVSDVIDFLRDIAGANISVNWRALEVSGVKKTTPVTLRLRNVPLRVMLVELLETIELKSPLELTVDQEVIMIDLAEVGAGAAGERK